MNGEANDDEYVLIAAVLGEPKDERAMRSHFRVKAKGRRTEYIHPDPEAVGYAAWLRSQWFAAIDEWTKAEDTPQRHADEWLPAPGRHMDPPPTDLGKLVQDWDATKSPLSGTAWSWMPNPMASFQDYFTPSEIVNAARVAMGDIDLDAASHWGANREHRIPKYYDATRSAFDNPWKGRVWLNPPYGNNKPWFNEIQKYVATGDVTQLCMLSPVWAFTTQIARPVMELMSAMVLLSPTPKFWGNADVSKTGSDQPHGIIYIGDRPTHFKRAFAEFGIPMRPDWSH